MKVINVAIVVLWQRKDGKTQLFFQTRREDGPLDGYLEFPGGKIEESETPLAAAKREFIEETGITPSQEAKWALFKSYNHSYSDRKVSLNVVLLNDQTLTDRVAWSDINEIVNDEMLEANHQIITDLKEKLS